MSFLRDLLPDGMSLTSLALVVACVLVIAALLAVMLRPHYQEWAKLRRREKRRQARRREREADE